MANSDQIQSLAKVVSEFAKTSDTPFQNPGEFHAKFFEYVSGDRPDQTTEDGRVLIIALRDVIFAHVNPRALPDAENLHSKYDAMISDWEHLMADVKASLPTMDDVLDSMFYPMMLPKFFERTLVFCGFQYLVGA
ncbi:MAG: hypothetical protein EOM40_20105 [Clostridia bacterium]|nr:hypothetical protein [Clostridia bacterium]